MADIMMYKKTENSKTQFKLIIYTGSVSKESVDAPVDTIFKEIFGFEGKQYTGNGVFQNAKINLLMPPSKRNLVTEAHNIEGNFQGEIYKSTLTFSRKMTERIGLLEGDDLETLAVSLEVNNNVPNTLAEAILKKFPDSKYCSL